MRQNSTTLAPQTQSPSSHRVSTKGAAPTDWQNNASSTQNLASQPHQPRPLVVAESWDTKKAEHTKAGPRKKRLNEDDVLAEDGRSQVMTDMADVDAMADTLPAQHTQLYAQASTGSEVATDAGAVSNSAGSITTATTSAPALGSVGLLGLGGFTFVGLAAAGLSGSKSTPIADSTAPKLDLSMAGTPQQGVTVVFTFSFNEDVTGFTSSSIKLSGGTPGNFVAVDALTYTLEVTVGSSGQPLTVSVAPGAAKDLAGNAYAEGLVFETTSIAPPVDPPSPLEPPAPAPDTTAPKFTLGTAASVAFAENATGNVHTASATDNVAVMAYAFAGGKDDDKFNLDTASGAITFKTPPDFEAPSSATGTNNYTVRVKATDAAGNSMVQEITVNVTNVDDVSPTVPDTSDKTAPTFNSINPSVSVPENTSTTVHTAAATDNVGVTAYAFAGGADDGKFNLDSSTGALSFKLSPDFEAPGSAASSNAYSVKIKATDAAGNSAVQTLKVNVTDVQDVQMQGIIVAGPIVVAGLQVQAQGLVNGQWTNLSMPSNVDANGNYSLKVPDHYTGAVKLVVIDTNGVAMDYRDEATGQLKDIDDLSLMTYVNAGTPRGIANVVNITPLTTLASQLAQDDMSNTDATKHSQLVRNSAKAVADIFGLTGDLNTLTPQAVIDTDGNAVQGNAYGAALAIVSGMEKVQGADTLAVINTLKSQISVDLLASTTNSVYAISTAGKDSIQSGYNQTSSLLQNGGNASAAEQLVQGLQAKTMLTAVDVFAQAATQGGYYQTMFDLASASYVHPEALYAYPGMSEGAPLPTVKGISFSISAADLGLNSPSGSVPTAGAVFSNGYFVGFDQTRIDRASIALLGRSQDALFLIFRGTNNKADWADNITDIDGHFDPYQALFLGIEKYLAKEENLGIRHVYVGGHSLGGQMAHMYMSNHANDAKYQAVTFEPANKYFKKPVQFSADGQQGIDPRIIRFETEKDPVPDLSDWNYGKGIHIEGDPAWTIPGDLKKSIENNHGLATFKELFPLIFSQLDDSNALPNALYFDDNKDGVIVTDPEELQAAYNFATRFDQAGGMLVINALDRLSGGTYILTETNVQVVVLKNDAVTSSENIDIDARPSDHGVLLIGNGGNNQLVGSRFDDFLIGSSDADVLMGGAGHDTLYGGTYESLKNIPKWVSAAAGKVNEHLDTNTTPNDVSFLFGGTGNDTLVCSDGDNDYCFIDVTLSWNAGNVDTVSGFNPTQNFANDYLIFSAEQLGISYNSLDSWGWDTEGIGLRSEWGSFGTIYQAPNLGNEDDDEEHFFKVATLADYKGENAYLLDVDNVGFNDYADFLPAWILDESTGYLYFDADGNRDYDDTIFVTQLTNTKQSDFKASNILVTSSFGDFAVNAEDVPDLVRNHAPTGAVSFTGNLVWGGALQATNTLQDANGISAGTINYRWQVSSNGSSAWTTIGTGETFALTAAYVSKYSGHHVRVQATYTDNDGYYETVSSAASVKTIDAADTIAPALNVTDDVSGVATGPIVFTFTFDESVTGFTMDKITVTGGTSTGGFPQADGSTTYTIVVTPLANSTGTVAVSVDLPGVTDLAGNQAVAYATEVHSQVFDTRGTTYTPGQASIDLGVHGKLIHPVNVDGNWYYVWDMNGDGVHNVTQNASGKQSWDGSTDNAAGSGYQYDFVNHDVLDGILKYASDFSTVNPGADTDNSFRFAILNNVKLALPTIGNGSHYVSGSYYATGTAIDNSPVGVANPNFGDLLAIWDAHNGAGTGTGANGTPPGWHLYDYGYWSATPSSYGHTGFGLAHGLVSNSWGFGDNEASFVGVQVLPQTTDTTAPLITSAHSASIAENAAVATIVFRVVATDNDTKLTYSISGVDAAFFNIDAVTGQVWFKQNPDYEAPADADGNNNYEFFVRATDSSGNVSADHQVIIGVADVAETPGYTPGQATISLGEYGNLIAPVFVDGNWYYAWDMNGDGVHSRATNSTGKYDYDGSMANAAGTGWKLDFMSHDVLDNIFKFTSDLITPGTNTGTDDVHRFAQINGVKLALPTIGDGSTYFSSNNSYSFPLGTAVDNNPVGETNAIYDDLLAIWDAHNGSGTGTGNNGLPAGWQDAEYWSATPSAWGHVTFYSGRVTVNISGTDIYAAVQVLPITPDTTAPTLVITDNTSGTATGDVLFTFTFSEAVTNFSANDVVLSAGTKGTFTAINASTYTLSVTPPQGSGSFTVDVDHLNGIVADTFGNALGDVAAVTQAYDIPTYTPGQAVISLGDYGNLIAPVFVDGNWYYAWDMNGDGVHSEAADNTGKFDQNGSVANAAGTGWTDDFINHDVLDNIFKFASDFTTLDTDNDTDNTNRFAKINGVKMALPTIGNGSDFVDGSYYAAGTAIDNNPAGEANPTYDDLLVIWDVHNGTPPGWQDGNYWSATPSTYGHAGLYSGGGLVHNVFDVGNGFYAAVQVL